MHVSEIILIAVGAFMLGSIPFGVVLAKLFGLPDPRTIGSGNIGATNMLRTGNKKVALLTLLLDAGKGALAVVMTYYVFSSEIPNPAANCAVPDTCMVLLRNLPYEALAVLTATLGHIYSPWLKFKGGKGVATITGALLAFSTTLGLIFCATLLVLVAITRIVSLSSLIAMSIVAAAAWFQPLNNSTCLLLSITVIIAISRHHGNIARLRAGTEPKLSFRKKESV